MPGRRDPERARHAVGRIERHGTGFVADSRALAGRGRRVEPVSGKGGAGQAVQRVLLGGVAQLGLGAQHIHRQALERGGKDVAAAHQQDQFRLRLDADETRDHTALGGAQRGQAGVGGSEQGEVLCELAVEEAGGVRTFGTDHAEMGEGGHPIENDSGHR